MTAMSFPQYRELLVHIHKEHSPNRHVAVGRKVSSVECSTNMATGAVEFVKIHGADWTKTLSGESLLDRCHSFLDDHTEAVDPVQDQKQMQTAVEALHNILLSELGRNSLIYGDAFGVEEIKFTIPTAVLKQAAKEIDDAKGDGTGTAPPGPDSGKPSRGHGKAAGAPDGTKGNPSVGGAR